MRFLDDERSLLLTEIDALVPALQNEASRQAYTKLRAAVEASEVPEALMPPLERLLEMGLETGRIRQTHSAHGEMAAVRIFQRTPRGAALKQTCDAANSALEALQGQPIENLSFSLRGPGAFTLAIETEQGHLTVHIDRHGVRVRSVEVGS